jgi:SnoaL-like domain
VSQQNVERFLEATEAFNRADWNAYAGFFEPEATFEPHQAELQGTYVGREGVIEWASDVGEHYAEGWLAVWSDIRDLGERLLALGTLRFTGKGSGLEMEVPLAAVATYRKGLIVHFRHYGDRDRALEAAGLSE